MSEFSRYIGIPYERGAQGPDRYDCAGLVRQIQQAHFGVPMPEVVAPDYDDGMAMVGLIKMQAEAQGWEPVSGASQHGDIVVIRRPYHVGVWLDIDGGGVLHAITGACVIWTPDASWRASGFGRREYLRHRSRI